jgi:hypothetical protein
MAGDALSPPAQAPVLVDVAPDQALLRPIETIGEAGFKITNGDKGSGLVYRGPGFAKSES